MINEKTSRIFALMKMYSIVGVVFIHAPKVVESSFTSVISKQMPAACVAMFFMLSGLFLFRKNIENVKVAISEIRKRVRSLFVPFVFWNLTMLILSIVVIKIAPSISNGGAYTIDEKSFSSMASALFGIGRSPINYQFWFIRNLMVFVLFAPVFKLLLVRSPWIGLAVSLIVNQYLSGALFFYLGGVLALYVDLERVFEVRNEKMTIGLSFGVFVVALFMQLSQGVLLCASFALLIGVSNFEFHNKFMIRATSSLSNSVFFVYATHEPTITILERMCRKIPVQSYVYKHVEFVLLPLVAILITWFAALFVKKFFGGLYSISTGAR